MPSTVRISDHGRDLLGQLAEQTGSTMTEVLDAALESYRRQHFLQEANRAYAALAEDAAASKNYREELNALESTPATSFAADEAGRLHRAEPTPADRLSPSSFEMTMPVSFQRLAVSRSPENNAI
jgi:predicted transcriptional regulator